MGRSQHRTGNSCHWTGISRGKRKNSRFRNGNSCCTSQNSHKTDPPKVTTSNSGPQEDQFRERTAAISRESVSTETSTTEFTSEEFGRGVFRRGEISSREFTPTTTSNEEEFRPRGFRSRKAEIFR
jgi:hypothetical protein